ncbi:MAG: biotin/lipoyl-binding protein [Dehalococcoidia bacterium]|nr:biotin/lipoyl-binding protein [Dehalococcoidia bacterium]
MEVRSVVQGRVVDIVAAIGTSVEAGDDLVIVESMKMEVPIQAPQDGSVTEVRVGIGDAVEEGTVLVVLG